MLSPLIRRPRRNAALRSNERGFTLALVAVSMLAIIAMAALSIDIGTLYEAKAEAQRAADAAALTAARVISISGITGDPTTGSTDGSWSDICGGAAGLATMAAISVAQQNLVGGVSVPTASVTVTYGAGTAGGSSSTCVSVTNFGVNPIVTVKVQRTNLPTFFARVFSLVGGGSSAASVSATASAEVFNPSGSAAVASSGLIIPVNPRCVKPWIIPNVDPTPGGGPFVNLVDGSIAKPGVSQLTPTKVIGEQFTLTADCIPGAANCLGVGIGMIANPPASPTTYVLQYVPTLVQGNLAGAIPSCSPTTGFQPAIAGCDQSTVYACGTPLGAQADLSENPVTPTGGGDTFTAVQCLTHSGTGGEDSLNYSTFPFQIQAGFDNPLVKDGLVFDDDTITTSNSIVTLPIYDGTVLAGVNQPPVTIVGFLQVFINVPGVATNGNMSVTVLNVAGCSNTATNPAVAGTSPVPIRLITPP